MNKQTELLIWILIITISIIIILVSAGSATPDQAKECMYCHNNFNIGFADEIDECGGCHEVVSNPTPHNTNTCKKCHGVKDQKSYHTTHSNISCSTCHGIYGQGKPSQSFNDCVGCHSSEVHTIHDNCSTCHEASIQNKSLSKTTIDYSKYTLYSLLTKLFNIMG